MNHDIPTLTVNDLDRMRQAQEPHHLIDVRETDEYHMGNIDGQHIPLSTLPDHLDDIKAINKPILLLCKAGGRSKRATEFLLNNGVKEAFNVAGGMLAWKNEIDPNIKVK